MLAYTIVETFWIRKLLVDFGIHIPPPTKLYCDNVSASYMTVNSVQQDRSKHIVVDYHFLRDEVARDDLIVHYIPTTFQLVDIFVKGLCTEKFEFFRINLPVTPPIQIEGG